MLKDTLKSLRESKGLTKKLVAQGVGVSERAYIAYEYGERDVSTDTLCKLAKFYGVTADYLLGLEPPKQPKNPMELLGIEKTVDDDEFIRLYDSLPDYAKQIFVDTMAVFAKSANKRTPTKKRCQATIGELQEAQAQEEQAKKDAV